MSFLNEELLLESSLADDLYKKYAVNMPIVDYHCHLSPEEIFNDINFNDITHLWLSGDHYKWRLMRNCGVDERFITGDASPYQKFEAFCKIMPLCIGNPVYIWCHLELKKYFNYTKPISSETCEEIYLITEEKLNSGKLSARNLIKNSNVEVICTTDDPADTLEWHFAISRDKSFSTKVFPSFRPDKALNLDSPAFVSYIKKLGNVCETPISNIKQLKHCLSDKLKYFVNAGCKVSDHAVLNYIFEPCSEEEANNIFEKALNGENLDSKDCEKYRTYMLLFLAKEYKALDITMQLHFCSQRNLNSHMFNKLGPDTGYDSIHMSKNGHKLTLFLDELEKSNTLPKTILYSLDPNDNRFINSVINCFQGEGISGKLQHGSAWWFNDTEKGMKEQICMLAEYGVLGNFIGMLTDSRSFTSYVRHDYFRRILCSVIAKQVNEGKYPNDEDSLKMLIERICLKNVRNYLNLN